MRGEQIRGLFGSKLRVPLQTFQWTEGRLIGKVDEEETSGQGPNRLVKVSSVGYSVTGKYVQILWCNEWP